MTETPAAAPERQVLLQKIFLKDASLEVPKAPQVFTQKWQPQIDIQLATGVQPLGPDQFQILLSITVTAKLEDDIAFLAEVHQGGIFQLRGFTDADRQRVLGTECVGTLFPFAREAVADLIQRGGFPQLLLQPVDFATLYEDHVSRPAKPGVVAH